MSTQSTLTVCCWYTVNRLFPARSPKWSPTNTTKPCWRLEGKSSWNRVHVHIGTGCSVCSPFDIGWSRMGHCIPELSQDAWRLMMPSIVIYIASGALCEVCVLFGFAPSFWPYTMIDGDIIQCRTHRLLYPLYRLYSLYYLPIFPLSFSVWPFGCSLYVLMLDM